MKKTLNLPLAEIGQWLAYFYFNFDKFTSPDNFAIMLQKSGMLEVIYLSFASSLPSTAVIGTKLLSKIRLVLSKIANDIFVTLVVDTQLFWEQCLQVLQNESLSLIHKMAVANFAADVLSGCNNCHKALHFTPFDKFTVFFEELVKLSQTASAEKLTKDITQTREADPLYHQFVQKDLEFEPKKQIERLQHLVPLALFNFAIECDQEKKHVEPLFPTIQKYCLFALKTPKSVPVFALHHVLQILVIYTRPLTQHLYTTETAKEYLPFHDKIFQSLCDAGLEKTLIEFLNDAAKTKLLDANTGIGSLRDFSYTQTGSLVTPSLQLVINYIRRSEKTWSTIIKRLENFASYLKMAVQNYTIDGNYFFQLGSRHESNLRGDEVPLFCFPAEHNFHVMIISASPKGWKDTLKKVGDKQKSIGNTFYQQNNFEDAYLAYSAAVDIGKLQFIGDCICTCPTVHRP
jgi:hypothetical protein